jgi:release factor glutamine methyltransferase
MSVGIPTWLDRAEAVLAEAGVPSPRADAVLLAVDGVGVGREQVHRIEDPGPDYWSLLARRARREPLQHLVGRSWFRHLEVVVGPGVFIPRPETELVAGAAVEEAQVLVRQGRHPVVADLGTGSGVIALSVAHEVPAAIVHAVEVDPVAHAWAARNCAGTDVSLHLGDLADCLSDMSGVVDVVVSNPPYIPPDGVPVDPEVRDHDPSRALYGSGPDGLGEVRAVVATAERLLVAGGLLVIEHADTQARAVLAEVQEGWTDSRDHRDLTGRARYVTARRHR